MAVLRGVTEAVARSARLLSLVLLLQSRPGASARELADRLGVSRRTVYRDVGELSALGVPVYAETGRHGGYRLVDGYRTTLTGLTEDEAQALFLVGLPQPAASLGLGRAAEAAADKMLAALGSGSRERAHRARDRFLVDLPAWYADADRPAALPELADAVLADRRVRLRYWRWAEPREVTRTVEPHGLVVKNGTWYLVARPAGSRSMRVYRVGNVRRLQMLEQTFTRAAGFDLAAFWGERLAEFDRQRVTATATVRLAPQLVERLPDSGDRTLLRAAEAVEPGDDGSRTVQLPIESPGHAAAWLVRHGAELEVLDPPELRAALAELAAAVLARYPDVTAAGTAGSAGTAAAAGTGRTAPGTRPAPAAPAGPDRRAGGSCRTPAGRGGRRPAR